MRILILLANLCTFFLFFSGQFHHTEWTSLLDKDLTQWETYLSYRMENSYKGAPPKDAQGKLLQPIGYNKNTDNVFSTVEENGQVILRISGEIYGCIFTKKDFKNYHLKLKVKFGKKKWPPRLLEPMDSGILYNSRGACGKDYWRSWMLSQEFQIIEESLGDYWCIANAQIDIPAVKNKDAFIYDSLAKPLAFGGESANGNFCKAGGNFEVKGDGWNTLELISFGDKSIHLVNGNVAMALSSSRYTEGKETHALTSGKIQLQSEAAEVFFKEIEIMPIQQIPQKYIGLFKNK